MESAMETERTIEKDRDRETEKDKMYHKHKFPQPQANTTFCEDSDYTLQISLAIICGQTNRTTVLGAFLWQPGGRVC